MEDSGGHFDKLRHGSIDAVAKTFSRGVEVIESTTRHWIPRVDDCRGFTDDSVTFFPAVNVRAKFRDHSTKFVAQHDRIIDGPRMIGGPLMQVAATDADVRDFE